MRQRMRPLRHRAGTMNQQHVTLHMAEVVCFVKLTVRDVEQGEELATAHVDYSVAAIATIKQHHHVTAAKLSQEARQSAVHFERRNHAGTEVVSGSGRETRDSKSLMNS